MSTLAEGEHQIDESTVRTSLLLFWLRTNLTLTNKRLTGTVPNTILALFPLGRREITQPLSRISNVGYDTKFHLVRFLIGAILLVIGVGGLADGNIESLFILALSLLPLGWSWVARITVTDNSGKENDIPVSMLDKEEVDRFLGVINTTLAATHDTPAPPQAATPPPTSETPDRIDQLQKLTALRDAGVLSEDEFEAEKRRIMNS